MVDEIPLTNIQQLYYRCEPRGMIEFIESIYEAFPKNTQTIIFVNRLNHAEKLLMDFIEMGHKAAIITRKMNKEEIDK